MHDRLLDRITHDKSYIQDILQDRAGQILHDWTDRAICRIDYRTRQTTHNSYIQEKLQDLTDCTLATYRIDYRTGQTKQQLYRIDYRTGQTGQELHTG
jgi:AraC-like DNA-binding protein